MIKLKQLIQESKITERVTNELLDAIGEIDDWFNEQHGQAEREWSVFTEDLFYDYSGDGDSGTREVYWADIEEHDIRNAIDYAYELGRQYNLDVPDVHLPESKNVTNENMRSTAGYASNIAVKWADPETIEQDLINFIDNAYEASGDDLIELIAPVFKRVADYIESGNFAEG